MMEKPFKSLKHQTTTRETTRIDIYQFSLNQAIPEALKSILNSEEKKRANRFHFEHHQHRFTCARIMLKQVLANYLNIAPSTIYFDYGKQGKPYLPEYPTLSFNLSHSSTEALLAVGDTHPLGIDIERFSERPYLGIGEHVFSNEENKRLSNLPNTLKPLMFFNTWAQKEAFIKLLGLGLTYPTQALTVQGLAQSAYQFLDPIYKKNWQLLPFMPKIGYAAALCCHPEIKQIHYAADTTL